MFEELGARRFGIIFQDDSFGRSVLASYESALEAFNLSILAKSSYSRHTHAVHASVFVMEKADLDVVMLATTTGPAADAINTARSLGHEYTVGLLSFVESERLRALLDPPYERILLARVTPDATDDGVALVRRFHRALAAYRNAEPEASERVVDPGALEGYILGRFIIDVLERTPDEPTREAFLAAALDPEPVVIDEWVIAFEEGTNVGSNYVRLIDLAGHDSEKGGRRVKKLDDFAREETGEEWLREAYKVVSMRRNIMFRMLLESTRLLLFGNAGGTALIIGFMSTTGGQNEGRLPLAGAGDGAGLRHGHADLGADHDSGHHGLRQGSPRRRVRPETLHRRRRCNRSEVMFNVEGPDLAHRRLEHLHRHCQRHRLHRGRTGRHHFARGVLLSVRRSGLRPCVMVDSTRPPHASTGAAVDADLPEREFFPLSRSIRVSREIEK